ncbi:MAG: protein kinase [Candidatus Hydrogenedens sp.]|nr:protein kinase [Candidatus Hydrogenedens sp.]
METLNWFWDDLLGGLLRKALALTGMQIPAAWETAAKIVVLALILFAIWFVVTEIRTRVKDYRRRREARSMERSAEGIKQVTGENVEKVQNYSKAQVQEIERAIQILKKNKDYVGMAAKYSAIGKYKDAAKWYSKAGNERQSALAWGKAGNALKAASMLYKSGHYAEAGEFYAQKGKYKQAADAYEKFGDHARAGENYARAGKVPLAVEAFEKYFKAASGGSEQLLAAAGRCLAVLSDPKIEKKISKDDQKKLHLLLARQFEAGGQLEKALSIYQKYGDAGGAGQIYLKLGRLEEAANAMKAAGRVREAAEIGGKFYEGKGRWKEAAMAYEGAQSYTRAGDCWSKAGEAERAAMCYEQGGEFFGAGFARIHMKDWPKAVVLLQKVTENHPRFSEARALLGRAFYQMKDYEHCAATLDNYLTGSKVTSDNMDYYWMLALAYEQLGQLAKSKELLLKIRTVNLEYRDVSRRLSNIETRISLAPAVGGVDTGAVTRGPGGGGAVMSMVEQSLGQRFKLEQELGRGGMGVVYKATDTQLDRPVALKFLGSLVDGNEEYKLRFVREARSAAKVQHPNIVSIYDIGSDEGKAYIAMEYVDGPNLHRYLQSRGRIEPREAISIMVQAASALEAVHEAGIIHRDIKPDNILIAKGGLVKLMDFGLARGDGARLTASRVVMGTPCYMSPEQCRGEEVDGRTDIYALGLVFHELLTGQTVFAEGDVLKRQCTEVPAPPSSRITTVPPEVDAIVMKAVEKKADDRYQSVTDFIAAMRAVGK